MLAATRLRSFCQEAGICRVAIGTSGSLVFYGQPIGFIDEELLPFLKTRLVQRQQGRLLLVLHLFGSHSIYTERFIRAFGCLPAANAW